MMSTDRSVGRVDGASHDPIIRARGLRKTYGAVVAVDGVDIDVQRGSTHAVIGPNGAGKTTLFNLLSGVVAPTAGQIELDGVDVTGATIQQLAHRGVARSFQITNLFANLSVFENARLAAQAMTTRRLSPWRDANRDEGRGDAAAAVLERVGLTQGLDRPAHTLSHGDQRKLEFAMILAVEPTVMLLDEPTAGMGSDQVPDIIDLIERIGGDTTIVLVEHNMRIVMTVADTITVMHHGRVLTEGTPDAVADDADVRSAYLGTMATGLGATS